MSGYNNYETSYTAYGGGGGGGSGGGFIPGEGSQTSPGGRRDFAQDSLRPVTIKQILDAQLNGEEFKIDGTAISQLTFVAQIRNISTQATNLTYKLDDGTGSIEVKQWINVDSTDQDSPEKAKLVENAYCRVWGKLKSFNDRRSIGAQIIRPVEDHNEVSYHLLEATAVHLYYTRGPVGGQSGASGGQPNGGVKQEEGVGGADMAGYSAVAKKVFKYLSEAPQTNEGLHQQEIAASLGIDTAQVARAGDDLLAGGLIYTTVDDQTWAVLEAD